MRNAIACYAGSVSEYHLLTNKALAFRWADRLTSAIFWVRYNINLYIIEYAIIMIMIIIYDLLAHFIFIYSFRFWFRFLSSSCSLFGNVTPTKCLHCSTHAYPLFAFMLSGIVYMGTPKIMRPQQDLLKNFDIPIAILLRSIEEQHEFEWKTCQKCVRFQYTTRTHTHTYVHGTISERAECQLSMFVQLNS